MAGASTIRGGRRPGWALTLAAVAVAWVALALPAAAADPTDRFWPKVHSTTPYTSAAGERRGIERAPRFAGGDRVLPDSLDAYGHLGLGRRPPAPLVPRGDVLGAELSGDAYRSGLRVRGDNLSFRMAPRQGRMQFNSQVDVSDRRLTVGIALPF